MLKTAISLLGKHIVNMHHAGESAVHGALAGDVDQPLALCVRDVASDIQPAAYGFDAGIGFVTMITVAGMISLMVKADGDGFDRDIFSCGDHAHGHGGAGAECAEQEIIGRWAGVGAAECQRLIGAPAMWASGDVDHKARLRAGDLHGGV